MTGSILDRSTRLALRPQEAADAIGVSVKKFRSMLPEIPHVRHGGVVIIPVESLLGWLRDRSEAAGSGSSVDEVVDETLASLRRDSE